MKSTVSPAVAAVVVLALVAVIGLFMWSRASGKTFTKDQAGGGGQKMGSSIDVSKLGNASGDAGKTGN